MEIRTFQECLQSRRTLADCDAHIEFQRVQLSKTEMELTPEQVQRCLDPLYYFRAGIQGDIEQFEERRVADTRTKTYDAGRLWAAVHDAVQAAIGERDGYTSDDDEASFAAETVTNAEFPGVLPPPPGGKEEVAPETPQETKEEHVTRVVREALAKAQDTIDAQDVPDWALKGALINGRYEGESDG